MILMNKYSLKEEMKNYRRALYIGLIFLVIGVISMVLLFLTKIDIFFWLSSLTIIGIIMVIGSIISIREKYGTSK